MKTELPAGKGWQRSWVWQNMHGRTTTPSTGGDIDAGQEGELQVKAAWHMQLTPAEEHFN